MVQAQLSESHFLKYQSPFVEVITEASRFSPDKMGEYPFWARAIRHDFFKWDPTGKSLDLSRDCDFSRQRESLMESGTEVLPFFKDYFHNCEKELQTGTNNLLANAYLTDFMRLHPSQHPYARHVIFHLPNNVHLKGLLALKGDGRPRPFVILRLGIFSNTREFFPERYLFMQMFEQSPFNMLVLESMSGAEFLQNNSQYSLAGFDEGLQNYQIAKQLQSPSEPLSKVIESVHLLGVSFGGHGVFYASLLNQLNPKAIASFAAFCPLLQFQKTFEYHQSQGLNMWFMSYWARNRMPSMSQIFPQLDLDHFIPSVLKNIDDSYRDALSWDEAQPLRRPPSSSRKGFFAKNDFISDFVEMNSSPAQAAHNGKDAKKGLSPFLIFATQNDPIVPFELNSKNLTEGPSKIEGPSPVVVTLEQGSHCTIPSAYNWRGWTDVLQSYVMKSSQFHLQFKSLALPNDFVFKGAIDFDVTQEAMLISSGPWWSRSKFEISLELLPWTGLQKPFSSETQSMLRRWLYQNIKVRPSQDAKTFEIYWQAL